MTRHLLGLFNGRPGARAFRRHLATAGTHPEQLCRPCGRLSALVSRVEAMDVAA
jgi:tRNA-dihydrouridine synthase A